MSCLLHIQLNTTLSSLSSLYARTIQMELKLTEQKKKNKTEIN